MSIKMITREHDQIDYRICILWLCDITVHCVFYQNFYHCLFFWWKHILSLCIYQCFEFCSSICSFTSL